MRIVLLIVVPVVLLFGVALAIMWLPLPRPLPPALGRTRTVIAAVTTGVLGVGYLIGIVICLFALLRQAGQALDPALLGLGLTLQADVVVGRLYRGQVEGRSVEVAFVPGRALDRALLNVYVAADVGTRAAIGAQRPLLDCRACPAVDGTALSGLQVFAENEGWARSWLSSPGSAAAVNRLLDGGSGGGTRELYLQPDRLWLRARPAVVSAEQTSAWLDELLALARTAEGVD